MRKYIVYDITREYVLGKIKRTKKKYILYKLNIDDEIKSLYKVKKIVNNIIFVELSSYNEFIKEV